ncbi:MAG TPA: hypothetical protein VIW47_08620 [Nitrospiraceae bacterium]|jgi:hypothetical protein
MIELLPLQKPVLQEGFPLLPMADIERERKEKQIEEKLKICFVEVGTTLKEIHDRRGYEREYGTWEEYLRRRWHWTRIRGYQVMAAAETAINVKSSLQTEVPTLEHGFQLSRLKRREDLEEIIEAGHLKMPAALVRQVVDKKLGVVRGGRRRGRRNHRSLQAGTTYTCVSKHAMEGLPQLHRLIESSSEKDLPLIDRRILEALPRFVPTDAKQHDLQHHDHDVDEFDTQPPGPKLQSASREQIAGRLLDLVEALSKNGDSVLPMGVLLHMVCEQDRRDQD